MKIKRWDTQETIFELECDSMTELIAGAIKAEVSLRYAGLNYTDLGYIDNGYRRVNSSKRTWDA